MKSFQSDHDLFWQSHPAVLIGISFLFGIGSALFSLNILLTILFCAYLIWLKRWAALFVLPMAAIYSFLLYGSPPAIKNPCRGHFVISTVQPHQTPFHPSLLYKGTLYIQSAAIPCSVTIHPKHRVPADSDYILTGTLFERNPYDYTFKPTSWEKVPNTFCLAEWRYQAKKSLRRHLYANLESPKVAQLLTSLVTGEVDDRMLRFEFGRLGLQHILAISGFHFGVLIAFLSALLRFLPLSLQWLTMILLTTTYYAFIGDSPAVQRAYITVALFLLAKLIRRPTTPINLLGASLIIELILNPLIATNLGFQFSFGSCFGILLLYKPLERGFRKILPARPAHKTRRLSLIEGSMYLISSAFRNALSLTLAVNLALLPMLFLHFGKFPLMSLLYNLFFPFLIAMTLFGLLTTLLISALIPSLGKFLFTVLNSYTSQILDLTSFPPLLLDHSIYFQNIPIIFIPVYLFAILCLSIQLNNKIEINYQI